MPIEIRALEPEERQECLKLWETVFNNPGYFDRYFYGDVEWLPYYTQTAWVDGTLAAAVHICRRSVSAGDFGLTMGGIANVACLPDHRHKGLASACLEAAIRVMEADAMDFSLLFTGLHAFYERAGYQLVTWPELRADINPVRAAEGVEGLACRPAGIDDIDAIYAIYDQYNRTRPVTVERSAAYWRDWIGLPGHRLMEDTLVCCDADARVVGYVFSGARDEEVRVDEIGIAEDAPGAKVARALFGAAAALRPEAGRLRARAPIDPDLVQGFQEVVHEIDLSAAPRGMMRLHSREALPRAVAVAANERWHAAGRPQGRVSFRTPYGAVSLVGENSHLRAEPEDYGRALPESDFFTLLFGSAAPESVTADGQLLPFLNALFPPRAPVIWPADGF